MARVVVVGGGFGGLASAARLAKLGHEVTLVERSASVGGALSFASEDGFAWDAGPTSTLLPAVIRDLFRKSGRPLEGELDLEPLPEIREHRFEDGTSVRLPGGSRARPARARSTSSARGLGQRWVDYVASYADDWETLRRGYLEVPWDPDAAAARAGRAARQPRDAAQAAASRTFKDDRLRLVAGHRVRRRGPRPAQRAGLARASRRTSSSGSARGRSPAGWPRLGEALARPDGDPEGDGR